MIRPETEAELAEAVRMAKGPLSICGGATRGVPVPGHPLSAAGLAGIELYEPGALTLVVGAGTPVAQIDAVLAAENQRLAFEPMDHRTLLGTSGAPTIGGVIAGNISGPRRIQAGAARDFALGVRFVDGMGQVVQNGGRVMKNVTGYDLVKLLCGSWGTLGILSQISLKVLPRPETSMTLIYSGRGVAGAVTAMSAALGSPFDVTGVAHIRAEDQTLIRLEGDESSVRYRADALEARLGAAERVEGDEDSTLWERVRDARDFVDHDAVWRVSVKPGDAPGYLDCLDQMHRYDCLMDWGGGLLWIAATREHLQDAASYGEATGCDTSAEGVRVLHANLQHNAGQMGGHATLVKAPTDLRGELSIFQPVPPQVAAISAGLRAKFDPRSILNMGLMG